VKRIAVAVCVVVALLMAGLGGCLAIGAINSAQFAASQPCTVGRIGTTEEVALSSASLSESSAAAVAKTTTDWWSGLTIKGGEMKAESAAIAVEADGIATSRAGDFPGDRQEKAVVIILTAGIVESGIHNLDYGDRDSLGWLQQRPSVGAWGTAEEIMQTDHATNTFFDHLRDVPNWWTMTVGDAAQAVQNSGFPLAYAAYVGEAQAIYDRMHNGQTPLPGCDPNEGGLDTAAIMAYARNQIGKPYRWDDEADGAGFVSAAYDRADVALPASMAELSTFTGNAATGLAGDWIPASDFESGTETYMPADILLWSDNQDATSPEDATLAGLAEGSPDAGTEFNIVTYNLRVGEGHEARIQRAKQLMTERGWDIVGFQEAENPVIYHALQNAFKGTKWTVYPENPDKVYRNGLNGRAIAYNTDRFELVSTDEIQFKRMEQDGDPQPAHAPVLRLRDRATGQEFYAINTHGSAYPRYAYERYAQGKAYVAKIQELKAEGLPIFFVGDFNSGFWMDQNGALPTLKGDRDNLTYCQLTKDGLMQNAKDVFDGIAGRGGGYCPRNKGEGEWMIEMIYTTPGVEVTEFGEVPRAITLSDHGAIYAHVRVPGVVTTPQSDDSDNTYIGPTVANGEIKEQAIREFKFLGAYRYTLSTPTIPTSGEWTLPVQEPYVLGSHFGESGPHWSHLHTGQDFKVSSGTPVLAATSGEIIYAGSNTDDWWAGIHIILRTSDGIEIWYCHLSSVNATSGPVEVGVMIGRTGATGNVTGPHLHFEIRVNGTPIDPIPVLQAHGLDP